MSDPIFWLFLVVLSLAAFSYLRSTKVKGGAAREGRTADDPYEAYTTEFDIVCRYTEIDSLFGPVAPSTKSGHEDALESFDKRRKSMLADISMAMPEAVERCRRAVAPRDLSNTAVTILIDHSGSMKREGIVAAATAVALISEFLARLGVSVEVLGFTTYLWKGGESRKAWLAAGKPPFPGRLNDLLHIIYKEHGGRFEAVDDAAYQTMLRPDILKENIDGEAVLWALQRLRAVPSERKLLILVSDGAPVDDSTLSVNVPSILHDHLIDVISKARSIRDVSMFGVGLEHNVELYYPDALTLPLPFLNGTELLQRIEQAVIKATVDGAPA